MFLQRGHECYFSSVTHWTNVYGQLVQSPDKKQAFSFQHSYSRVIEPESQHTPSGPFMTFKFYNVEIRDRVKCVSAVDGVPISTQWGSQGHYYPIQIAQYGLSHYSKYLASNEESRKSTFLENGKFSNLWNVHSCETNSNKEILSYKCDNSGSISMPIDSSLKYEHFSVDWKISKNSTLLLVVEVKGGETFNLYYVQSNTLIKSRGNNIFYGFGKKSSGSDWFKLTRNIAIDVLKGMILRKPKKMKKKNKILVNLLKIQFFGNGAIDNMTLSNQAHLDYFYYASKWLLLNQDKSGGWPINVDRNLANGELELSAGWYSAMAQGQAMSLLCRAYSRTGKKEYLEAAKKAAFILSTPSSKGGVKAKFADKYDWYEEYPTQPPSFVLNGFIYALIGLYDVYTLTEDQLSGKLYSDGMESLQTLLPLYDSGSGSFYDLRHYSLPGTAPNLARWDYHTTHINQLLLLNTIEQSSIFTKTAARWVGYMKGHRAKHN
ncbi:DgyrCDS4924 [Dimorphilus gyrociliatus]|uniref:heparosan-N-sulfate-glucuronate 5-epimerase n=1 Tax=Dimorphilus gyrociliatus TaxID=2664684 RepID=A0A7I8VJV8_9ANNE|nr:DgyrCDS4924 [Dimorphilus gyrociliatus]